MATISVFLPLLFSCTSYPPPKSTAKNSTCYVNKEFHIEDVELYNCPAENSTGTTKNYNEGINLMI